MQLAKRPLLITLGMIGVTIASIAQPGYLEALVTVVLFWIIWVIYALKQIVKYPQKRNTLVICICLWLIAYAIIIYLHNQFEDRARNEANTVISQIYAYYAKHNRYPSTLDELEISKTQQEKVFGKKGFLYIPAHSSLKTITYLPPTVGYRSTRNLFSRYYYDFKSSTWIYEPD